jgi:hypothetical protein
MKKRDFCRVMALAHSSTVINHKSELIIAMKMFGLKRASCLASLISLRSWPRFLGCWE